MDTTTNMMDKQAQLNLANLWRGLTTSTSLTSNLFKSYLAYAAALGALGGAGTGIVSSYVKSRDPEVTSLDRRKRFYERKIEEMKNENWLNELMTAKKKLESGKLSDEERADLEKKYIRLINQ